MGEALEVVLDPLVVTSLVEKFCQSARRTVGDSRNLSGRGTHNFTLKPMAFFPPLDSRYKALLS